MPEAVVETAIPDDLDVFELADFAMVLTDLTGRFRRVNSAFGRLVGRSAEELVGESFFSLTSPDDIGRSQTVIHDLATAAVETARFEKRYLRPDDSFVWVELNVRSLTSADGQVVGFLTQAVDITDRRRADQDAERHRRQLEEAQHIAGLGSFEYDPVTGAITASDEYCRILGLPALEDIATLMRAIHPDDRAIAAATIDACILDHTPADLVCRVLRPDGAVRWVHGQAAWTIGEDGRGGMLGTVLDITDRKRAEQAAERHSRQLEEAQHIAGLGSFEHDLVTGAIKASDELLRILGLPALEDVPTLMRVIHPDDRAVLGAAIEACIVDHTPADVVHRVVRPDGTVRWVHGRVTQTIAEDGRGMVLGTVLDITDIKTAENALEHQAFHDTLTGLANKALFVDRMGQALRRTERDATPVGVMILDLDDFRTVNDALGHAVGDRLLAAVAKRLAGATRASDTVARFGGDEFGVLLESGEMPQGVVDMAGRITNVLKAPFQIGDAEVSVRASIGAAIGHPRDSTSDDLLRDADLAMYLAKHNGKGRLEMFRPGMQGEALKHLAIITELRHALDHGEFEVFYQPIVSVHDSAPAGAEALVRWHHPRRGLTLPAEFVDVAESTGLIVPLGDWVLNEACRQTQAWRHAGVVDDTFYISVNLSARQLAEPALVDDVALALQDSGLAPSALVLEITESAIIVDFDAGLARLRSLKDLGIRLAIDDYGTGYSSLNRLGNLPVDIVKIDKSFIDRLTLNDASAALVRSVIDVTSALGLTSVAEGVEQQGQRTALDVLGCDYMQGYLFAKPAPPAASGCTLRSLRRHHSGVEKVAASS